MDATVLMDWSDMLVRMRRLLDSFDEPRIGRPVILYDKRGPVQSKAAFELRQRFKLPQPKDWKDGPTFDSREHYAEGFSAGAEMFRGVYERAERLRAKKHVGTIH